MAETSYRTVSAKSGQKLAGTIAAYSIIDSDIITRVLQCLFFS